MKKRKLIIRAASVLAATALVFGVGFMLHAQTEEQPAAGTREKVLSGIEWKYQRKDTRLLCLDGCWSERDQSEEGKKRHWDSDQPGKDAPSDAHGSGNCARASISMMVSFYGKHLSQDRIAYYMEEERADAGNGMPEGDLSHNEGMQYSACDGGEETIALEWALNESITFIHSIPPDDFDLLKGWLDENRPIMIRRLNYLGMKGYRHITVINGYRIVHSNGEIKNQIHILDPLKDPGEDSRKGWWDYPIPVPFSPTNEKETIQGVWVGPVSAPNAREDEASIRMDSDGDGIMDFDEQKRFFTDPFSKDTDKDGVDDKNDIREYVFDAQNLYSKKFADLDGDGKRKERDPDNDGDDAPDGCEDSNQNGVYEFELGETSNFNREDRLAMCVGQPVHNITDTERSGSMVYPTSNPVNTLNKPEPE